MKVTYYFTEKNTRLADSKKRSKTVEIDVKSAFHVDEVIKAGKPHVKKVCQNDSIVTITSYKVGVRIFEVNEKI